MSVLGWICNRCQLCQTDIHSFCVQLEQDISSADDITSTRAKVVSNAVEKVRKEGNAFTKDIHAEFNFFENNCK